jgi:hypothetical protein
MYLYITIFIDIYFFSHFLSPATATPTVRKYCTQIGGDAAATEH